MENTSVVACGEKMDVGCRVVLWDEPTVGRSFYKSGKYTPRNISLNDLRKKINLFVLHHSANFSAQQTYDGLNARGLSVNFAINDDIDKDGYATIYQYLDIKDIGWSHSQYNSFGPGVEICYQPAFWLNNNFYSEANIKKYNVQPHPILDDKIHGQKFKVFGPTPAQVKSCTALLKGFCKLFPDVKQEFPKDLFGNVAKTVVKDPKGLVSHFNLTVQKIDPMGFPFEQVEKQLKFELTPEGPIKTEGTLSRFGNWFIDKCKL